MFWMFEDLRGKERHAVVSDQEMLRTPEEVEGLFLIERVSSDVCLFKLNTGGFVVFAA